MAPSHGSAAGTAASFWHHAQPQCHSNQHAFYPSQNVASAQAALEATRVSLFPQALPTPPGPRSVSAIPQSYGYGQCHGVPPVASCMAIHAGIPDPLLQGPPASEPVAVSCWGAAGGPPSFAPAPVEHIASPDEPEPTWPAYPSPPTTWIPAVDLPGQKRRHPRTTGADPFARRSLEDTVPSMRVIFARLRIFTAWAKLAAHSRTQRDSRVQIARIEAELAQKESEWRENHKQLCDCLQTEREFSMELREKYTSLLSQNDQVVKIRQLEEQVKWLEVEVKTQQQKNQEAQVRLQQKDDECEHLRAQRGEEGQQLVAALHNVREAWASRRRRLSVESLAEGEGCCSGGLDLPAVVPSGRTGLREEVLSAAAPGGRI